MPNLEVCVDVDLIEWALARIGEETDGGCPYASDDGPDHHGPEFAVALFDALVEERRELDLLTLSARSAPDQEEIDPGSPWNIAGAG